MGFELRVLRGGYAARWYSLISPSSILRRSIRPYNGTTVCSLLWEPLPEAEAPRPAGLRAMIAAIRKVAPGVPQLDDVERRVRRAAIQAIVREAFQQTVAEFTSRGR